MINKTSYKKIIVCILITLILVLAVPVQSTQASLPGQTVPTAKPRDKKSSDESNPGQSPTSTPEAPVILNSSPQLPDATITMTEIQGSSASAIETLAPGDPAGQSVLATTAVQENITAPDSKLIPFFFSSDTASILYRYLGYAIIALALILFLSYMVFKRNRKEKPTTENKPG